MIVEDADEVVLETEVTNKPALLLYERLGFVRYFIRVMDVTMILGVAVDFCPAGSGSGTFFNGSGSGSYL